MNKPFLESFPTLNLDPDTRACFENVIIEKITSTRKQDLLMMNFQK